MKLTNAKTSRHPKNRLPKSAHPWRARMVLSLFAAGMTERETSDDAE